MPPALTTPHVINATDRNVTLFLSLTFREGEGPIGRPVKLVHVGPS